MKYLRHLLGFCIAGVIFVTVFYALQTRYSVEKSLKNPFEDLVSITEATLVPGASQIIRTIDGELVKTYGLTDVTLDKEVRELKDGPLFLSGVLLSREWINHFLETKGGQQIGTRQSVDLSLLGSNPGDLSLLELESLFGTTGEVPISYTSPEEELVVEENDNKKSAVEKYSEIPFSFQSTSFVPAEIKVGNVFVRYPLSSVFIEREKEKKRTSIYAYGAAVEIYFEGQKTPFILPSNQKVTLYDDLLNDKTAQLFYTKLQKDFRVRSFEIQEPEDGQEGIIPEVEIGLAWKEQESWRAEMGIYSKQSLTTLLNNPLSLGINDFANTIYDFQRQFAFGYPKRKEDGIRYDKTIAPFVSAVRTAQGGEEFDAVSLSFVKADVFSSNWDAILDRNSRLGTKWNSFAHSHQSYVRGLDSSDTQFSFIDFWFDTEFISSVEGVRKLFIDAQTLMVLDEKSATRDILFRLNEVMESVAVSPSQRGDLTNMRRVLIHITKSSSFFQKEEIFNLYRTIVRKEQELYGKDLEVFQEIRLENARDVLYFLNAYVEENNNSAISGILLDVYGLMEIEEITAKLNRNIFSEEETNVIEWISRLGNSVITAEEAERLKEQEAIERELLQLTKDLEAQAQEQDVVDLSQDGYIQDGEELNMFFEEFGLNLFKTTVLVSTEDKNVLIFENVNHKGRSLSGQFNIVKQSFETIDAEVLTKQNVRTRFFEGLLRELDAYDKEQEALREAQLLEQQQQQNAGPSISQGDRLSRVQRQYIFNLLRSEKISTKFTDIIILNEDRTLFQVNDAEIKSSDPKSDNTHVVGFIIDQDTNTLSEVTFGRGSSDPFVLEGSFELKTAVAEMNQAIDLILNREREED